MKNYCEFEIWKDEIIDTKHNIHYIKRANLKEDKDCIRCQDYYACIYLEILDKIELQKRTAPLPKFKRDMVDMEDEKINEPEPRVKPKKR